MNIRLSLYDVFSRIVPGGLYIAAIVQFLSILGYIKIDLKTLEDLSLITSIGFVLSAYTLGGSFDNLAVAFYRLFKKRGFSARSFADFKRRHADRWSIDFGNMDWPILLAYIRTKNLELAGELERHNALSIMLRNVSLGLLLLAANSLVQFFISRYSPYILISIVMLVLSLLSIRSAVKYRGWFYDGIYETILAYRIDLEESIKPVQTGGKQRKAGNGGNHSAADHKNKAITRS